MLAANTIVWTMFSTAAAHFPGETCRVWKTSHSSCYRCPCIDSFISAAALSYFTCSTKSNHALQLYFFDKGTCFRLEDLDTNRAERKWKEGALLFVKAGAYLCKVKLLSKHSLYRLRSWFANGIIMGAERPRKRINLFHKRDMIENVSSGTIMDNKVCNH